VRLGKDIQRLAGSSGQSNRRRFSEVREAFRVVRQVAKEWVFGKLWQLAPGPVKQWVIEREMRKIKAREEAEEAAAKAEEAEAAAGRPQQ
jgi:hypothetical protein